MMNLNTAEAVVDVLGGVLAVAELTGTKRSGVHELALRPVASPPIHTS